MKTPVLNHKERTIEMGKRYALNASKFGTIEYNELQQVRRDYPEYKVVTKSTRKSEKCAYSGLTYKFMEKYIKAHDDEEGTILAEYNDLRAKSDEAIELGAESASYMEIKDWFLKKFPAIADFHKKREAILANTAKIA